jgi:hypothetical protein
MIRDALAADALVAAVPRFIRRSTKSEDMPSLSSTQTDWLVHNVGLDPITTRESDAFEDVDRPLARLTGPAVYRPGSSQGHQL